MTLSTHINQIIGPYQNKLGKDFQAYKNHVHRVAILTLKIQQKTEEEDERKIAIAAVYHDLGIWLENTFDYLDPSIEAARKYLKEHQLEAWEEEISLMINMHHKMSSYQGKYADLVEPFRKADLIDLSKGIIRFGLKRKFIKGNFQNYPMLGFRSIIFKRFLQRLRTHPFSPLPMMKK